MRSSYWGSLTVLVCSTILAGCSSLDCRYAIDRLFGDYRETCELQFSYYDESHGSSTSTHFDIDELIDDVASAGDAGTEEFQALPSVDFWMRVREATKDKLSLTVRLEDQPAQEIELLLGERREFRPANRDRRISLMFCKVGYYE